MNPSNPMKLYIKLKGKPWQILNYVVFYVYNPRKQMMEFYTANPIDKTAGYKAIPKEEIEDIKEGAQDGENR